MTSRESARRIRMLGLVVVAGAALTAGRSLWLGLVQGDALANAARNQQQRLVTLPAQRGSIVDDAGQPLVVDRLTATVSADPHLLLKNPDTSPAQAAAALAPILRIPRATLAAKLSADVGYTVLAKGVDQDVAKRVRALDIPNVDVEDTFTRFSPLGNAAAQVVGITTDKGGQSGLEQQYNSALVGTAGRRVEARDPQGQVLRTISSTDSVPGQTVQVTIDATLQQKAAADLAAGVQAAKAKSGSVVVMRPQDGAILAMASYPWFNPNNRRSLDPARLQNLPVQAPIEPGSTFKLVTIGAALQEGRVTPHTVIHVPEVVKVYDRTLHDAHNKGAQDMTVAQILEESSNKGTVLVAKDKLGEARMFAWTRRMGFGKRTGVDLPAEDPGRIPTYGNVASGWSGTSILNVPIGQGVFVNQLQTARAYAAVANGGYLVTPHVVSKVGSRTLGWPAGRRVYSSRTVHQLDAILRRVVSGQGTGELAKIPGYDGQVAGKTGTASKVDSATGQYSNSRYVASFVGYVPAGDPKLVIVVTIDEPHTSIYGGYVAAPIFSQVGRDFLTQLQIPPG
ncbi:MAG: penicillin-binding protein 2 [Thermoleophilia bacterium]